MQKQLAVAFVLLAAAALPASAQNLTASEIEAEIIGKVVCVNSPNGEICIRHNANMTSEVVSGMPEMSGTWRFDGDQHCITWQGADERCMVFERDGEGYTTAAGPVTISE